MNVLSSHTQPYYLQRSCVLLLVLLISLLQPITCLCVELAPACLPHLSHTPAQQVSQTHVLVLLQFCHLSGPARFTQSIYQRVLWYVTEVEHKYPLCNTFTNVNVAIFTVSFISQTADHISSLSSHSSDHTTSAVVSSSSSLLLHNMLHGSTVGPLYVCQPSPLSPAAHSTSKPAQKHYSLLPGSIPLSSSPQRSLGDVVSPSMSPATSVVSAVSPPKISTSQQEYRTAQLQVTL